MENTYKVTAVNRHGHAQLPPKTVKGSKNIRRTKAELRGRLHRKRQSFDVYNQTKKKFVNY